MKQQRSQTAQTVINLRLWTITEAIKAVPYLRGLTQSLRDNWIELRQAQETVRRTESRPKCSDRDSLIRLTESNRDVARAEGKLQETINEMVALSAYCLDPVAGLAVIPFRRNEVLAWFVFDLFDPQGVIAWRFHTDPPAKRRPLTDLDHGQLTRGVVESPLSK